MTNARSTNRVCAAERNLFADLVTDDLLTLGPGERLWKLYCFRPTAGNATGLEHRIYTKIKPDGRLALVTFAVHTPVEGCAVRSALARVPDLSADHLDHLITAIRSQTGATADDYDELDLSGLPTLEEQLGRIADGGWRMANSGWQIADGRWQMADGGWRMADGGWQMADGRWQMANGRWQMADP